MWYSSTWIWIANQVCLSICQVQGQGIACHWKCLNLPNSGDIGLCLRPLPLLLVFFSSLAVPIFTAVSVFSAGVSVSIGSSSTIIFGIVNFGASGRGVKSSSIFSSDEEDEETLGGLVGAWTGHSWIATVSPCTKGLSGLLSSFLSMTSIGVFLCMYSSSACGTSWTRTTLFTSGLAGLGSTLRNVISKTFRDGDSALPRDRSSAMVVISTVGDLLGLSLLGPRSLGDLCPGKSESGMASGGDGSCPNVLTTL